jgi:hypothetical protein
MADLWRDFCIRETGTGQQVTQLHDRRMMMMMTMTLIFCFVFLLEQTAIIPLNNVYRLVLEMKTSCVFWEVGTELLDIILNELQILRR